MVDRTRISPIGLGCVTFGREIGQEEAFAVMDYAVLHGVNFFDTAAAYGKGASEQIVGNWLASRQPAPDSILVATKILPPYGRAALINAVQASMKRLRTASLDLLYLHAWDPAVENADTLQTLDELVQEGKVRMLGASNFTAAQLQKAIQLQRENQLVTFRVVQNNHNLAVSDLNDALRNVCRENQLQIITYSPLGAGFLTGKHQQGVAAGSRFDLIPGHQNVYFNEHAQRRLKKLQAVADRTGLSPVHLALAWALHQPGITTVLIGGRNPSHLEQAIAALLFNDAYIFAELENT